MYSTNLKDNKYPILCLAVLDQVCIVDFVVDTGAMFTCCNYTSLKTDICEVDFADREIKFLGGFVKGSPVRFYKCSLRQVTVQIGLELLRIKPCKIAYAMVLCPTTFSFSYGICNKCKYLLEL